MQEIRNQLTIPIPEEDARVYTKELVHSLLEVMKMQDECYGKTMDSHVVLSHVQHLVKTL